MSETTNTALWDTLKKTDPKATKPFKKGGGFTGTQIDPVWRAQRMTEVFGPIGKGWGYDITERWSEEFKTKDGTVSAVYVTVNAWYTDPETKERLFTGPQIGGTEVGRAADEAYKMAVTDALTKCLVNVGLCADVYLGLFDDSKYRDAVAAEYEGKRREEAANRSNRDAEGYKAAAAALKLGLDGCGEPDELTSYWREHKPQLETLPQDLYDDVKAYAQNRKRLLLAPAHPAE
ncbi:MULTISPECIES: hypothetical protein [unclassified Azospirillum]|uniref:hypothetical protein n=1 Tax=unclassified Azospirillum TaxID=2630922 RepID=UPI000D652DD8|nr:MULTISPECIES: hypothetical protein [unclassified Azospirillum]